MLTPARTRLEVWGDPVAHSRSPQLHAAAYGVLGLDWSYERRRVAESDFATALEGLAPEWRGLSLTMPLKGVAYRASAHIDRPAALTGAVNTLLLRAEGRRGFNTDVGGLVRALREEGIAEVSTARIVGAGATATSALVSLAELGAVRVEVVARRPEAVAPLAQLGARLGVDVVGVDLDRRDHSETPVTIATLPGDTPLPDGVADALAAHGGLLLDVVYGHWPTALADSWRSAGNRATSGRGMLLHQALLQVRVFVGGDPDAELPDETAVLAAMRSAVVGD